MRTAARRPGASFGDRERVLNRLFTNRIESKTERTLLILLKPTILIQNEEEEKNFPGLLDSLQNRFGTGL